MHSPSATPSSVASVTPPTPSMCPWTSVVSPPSTTLPQKSSGLLLCTRLTSPLSLLAAIASSSCATAHWPSRTPSGLAPMNQTQKKLLSGSTTRGKSYTGSRSSSTSRERPVALLRESCGGGPSAFRTRSTRSASRSRRSLKRYCTACRTTRGTTRRSEHSRRRK